MPPAAAREHVPFELTCSLVFDAADMGNEDRITWLLERAVDGDEGALDELMRTVYADLERIAKGRLRERFGHGGAGLTLEPSALVHETFLRLEQRSYTYENRRRYFALASQVMLSVINDYYRNRKAAKRGGDAIRVTLSGLAEEGHAAPAPAILDLTAALEELEELNPYQAEVVKLRSLWGYKVREIAEITGTSIATVERAWRFAKNWLADELDFEP